MASWWTGQFIHWLFFKPVYSGHFLLSLSWMLWRGYPEYQSFFSRAAGIFGVGRRPETALEKSLAPRVWRGGTEPLSNSTLLQTVFPTFYFKKNWVNSRGVPSCSHEFIPVKLISIPFDFEPGTWNLQNPFFPRNVPSKFQYNLLSFRKFRIAWSEESKHL